MSPERHPVRVPKVYHINGQFEDVADAFPPVADDVFKDHDDC